ncbi:cadherin-like domain-containing protein [Nostoc sp. CHAB 5844]|nr:cadherin-like domain-containing protein [Nostoc sp. CHAB 5844]
MAATILNPGDIAIVGYINNGTPDSFSFVNLVPIGSGTVVYFTDNGWTGTGFRGVSATDADGNENVIRFTANADLPAGTVIRTNDTSADFTWTRSGSIVAGAAGSYADLSFAQGTGTSGGDQITAVQSTGASPLLSGFTAITQIDYTGAFEDATTSNSGSVAPGLSQAANTAVLFGNSATYAAFNLNTLSNGTQAEWLAAINNAANWTFGNATSLPTGSINVAGGTGSQPDLTVSLVDSPDPVIVGNPLTYTLTVSNSGTANTSNITVQYTLPDDVTFNGTSVSNGFTASQAGNIVTFTGGSINAGSNASLTVSVIPNTAGSITSGIATVDPSNTITESNENNNTAAAITTTVNNVQVGQAPTIVLNTASTTDLLDANGALPLAGLGAVSGVIGNPNDPARTLGLDFTIADADTDVTNLTVTVSSSNTAVVPNANLTLTGSGASRNLRINPVGVGNTNIVVTVSDGGSTANYTIAYAASANNGTATTQFLTGASDASTAISVGGTYFLAGDDESQVLRLYDYSRSGLPVAGFDFTSSLGLTQTNSSGNLREVDIEASTRVGDRIFWLGSQSNNEEGNNRPNRNRIFATDITGTGATTTLSYAGRYDFLRQDIINWDVNNLHGRGANYYGLAASAATGVGSQQPNGYNIEGLTIAPDSTTAYVAFRAPQVPPGGRSNALIVPVTNFTSLLTNDGGTQGSAQFGAPIELDLGGRGIREIRQNGTNQYVIIAGPAGNASTAPNDFRLYTWDGNPNSAPQLRAATFPTGFNPEGIISIPDNLTNTSQIQFISDDGDVVLYNNGTAQDLAENNFKKFRTDSITLGSVVLTPRIHDIQGTAHISSLNGQNVADVPGIVTAVRSNGFYLQDPNPDNDDRTSEGIFIFTSSAPTVQVGDSVLVNGRVSEFRPGGATSNNLTTTQIVSPTISILSRNNPLPAATILGNGGRAIPNTVIEDDANGSVETSGVFDPANDGIDFYESLEGTLVQINNPVAVSPTNSFGEIWVLGDNGANATGRTARGGIVVSPGDFNPERIQIDDTLLTGGAPQVSVGATFNTITGVVDYSFSNFEVLPTSVTVTAPSPLTREVTNLTPTTDQLTVATFNVENLDPGDGPTQFNNLANRIVNNLRSPDILSLEEIQDNNGPTNDSVVDASVTFQTLINAITAAGGPTYEFRQINPVDDTNGGEPGGNIRVGYLFNPERVSFVDRPGGSSTSNTTVTNVNGSPTLSTSPGLIDPTNPAFSSSRKPLVGEFVFNGQTVYLIGNHFNSKGGDQPLFGVNQPPNLVTEVQRQQQATIVRNFVQDILAIDPNANVVVLGDLNDFEFSNPVNTIESAGLTSLIETLPANERYTYNFEGNAQVLDHILASQNLVNNLDGYDVVHINSEFIDQVSDHDPVVARFNLPANQAPTAVVFNNAIASIDENTNTTSRIRVADIAITDDALGTNNLSLTGVDGNFFEIANSVLYLRANTNLDFETKSNYSVTVAVDDPTVGNTPDAVANFSLAVNNVNEAPIARNDSATTTDIQPVIINVLANDTDPDSNPLTINSFTNPTRGNLVRNNDNTFTYTPQIGFSGTDSFTYTISDGNLTATATVNLTVTLGSNQINGTNGNNILIGTSRIDVIRGLGGNDIITGLGNNDVIYGGDGNDAIDGSAGNDSLYGENGNDILMGGDGNDTLDGGAGDDMLVGGAGNDKLIGGLGRDILAGGDGRDSFYLTNTRTGNFDTIIDFVSGIDNLVVSQSEFGLNQALGTLNSSLFRLGTSATAASDRFIYDRSTGRLFFDQDGIGSVAKVQIAQLSNRPTLANTDFTVIA